jgi:hypothetical protein
MANLFDKKYSGALSDLLGGEIPAPENHYANALSRVLADPPSTGTAYDLFSGDTSLAGILNSLPLPPTPSNRLSAAAADLFGRPSGGIFGSLALPPTSSNSLTGAALDLLGNPSAGIFGTLAPAAPTAAPAVKRKAFFSFHFDDVMRVNNVRMAWKISHPDSILMRSFYDSSLWESRKLEDDEALKRLIREGVQYTSAVCVLIGTETSWRRWVKYEVARAIIDGRGLLAVHLNNIRHHQTKTPHPLGLNPLDFVAVGKVQERGETSYRLFDKTMTGWARYSDYTGPVTRPGWLNDPPLGYVMPLSTNAALYDYVANEGHKNIGAWIDQAAQRAGR